MAKSPFSRSEYVTLRSIIDKGPVDSLSLEARLDDQEITIISVLTNTAVYVLKSSEAVKRLETVEKIMVKKTGIVYLPVKESIKPFSKPKPK